MWLLCAAALLMALALGACPHIPDAEELLSNTTPRFSENRMRRNTKEVKQKVGERLPRGRGCCARTQGRAGRGPNVPFRGENLSEDLGRISPAPVRFY